MLCCVLCMPDVYVLAGTIAMFGTIEVCVVPFVLSLLAGGAGQCIKSPAVVLLTPARVD